MASKVIFLDVDGTLVDYENHLPESAVEAIRKARANGHLVYICTGRSHAEVPPKLWNIGWDDWWQWFLCRAPGRSRHAPDAF